MTTNKAFIEYLDIPVKKIDEFVEVFNEIKSQDQSEYIDDTEEDVKNEEIDNEDMKEINVINKHKYKTKKLNIKLR